MIDTMSSNIVHKVGLRFADRILVLRIADKKDLLENNFFCKQCPNAYFSTSSQLQEHMHLHEDSEPVEVVATRNCRHCGVPFISNRALAIHCRNFHGETLGFSCNLCRKQFVTRQYLNLHVRTHKIGDRFYCSDCGHWYRSVEELSKHKECCKCAEQGSYSCEFCPKTFKYPKDKVLHERTHTGIKPFTCKYCDARFSQTSALKVHTRIHTNERPHKCRFCPADFTDSSATRKHELKFHCKECQETTRTNR